MSAGSRGAARGFTLIELLVVILIFGVFALMAYGGLDSVLNTRRDVERALDRTAALQKAYMKLRNDLQQVANRPARDGYGDTQPAMRSDAGGRLEFTRGGWRNPTLQPRPTLERVAWRLADRKLTRESFRVLDQAQDSVAVALTVLEEVEEFRFRFLGGGATRGAPPEWVTAWPPLSVGMPGESPAVPPPPLAVEVTIVTKDWGELVWLFKLGIEAVSLPEAWAGTAAGAPDRPDRPGDDDDPAPCVGADCIEDDPPPNAGGEE